MGSSNSPWSAGWQPLINADGTPTPMCVELFKAFFNVLDPQHSGYVWPETYSAFLDNIGYEIEENTWKRSFKPISLGQPINNADAEFKIVCENFGFEHVVVDRDPQRPFRLTQGIGGTPLLTLRGFIDITTLETAGAPDRSFVWLNRALQHYRVWSQLGPLPRWCIPAVTPTPVQLRIQRTSALSQERSRTMQDAAAAQFKMEARGRQQALDLIDSTYLGGGYVYRPGLI